MKLEITSAKASDVPALLSLLNEALRYKLDHGDLAWGEEPYSEDEVRTRIARGTVQVARINGHLAGTVMLQWEDEVMWGPRPGDAGYLHGLAIKDSFHGQNIGGQIIAWAAAESKKAGRSYLRLDCPADNERLCGYYEAQGFARVAVRPNPSTPGWTTAYFELKIV